MTVSLKIGILGTRGIPNRYGGFEQCAEYLALGLVQKGHKVWVYNAHDHEYQADKWNGVNIIHCNDPEDTFGTFGQFIYDWNCINDARKRNFDILLQLGYTSNSIWHWRWPRGAKNIVNMDGLEWKRSKYSQPARRFLKLAERWAAKKADMLIADSPGIQQYLSETFERPSTFIPYGAEIFESPDAHVLDQFSLQPNNYHLLIARMEPENNIEMVIKGHLESNTSKSLVIVGSTGNKFGALLKGKYIAPSVVFLGAIYDAQIINNLRYFSTLYFHGHSVGGTNPSLLEAMGCSSLIAAHDNPFNRAVLGEDGFYFANDKEVADLINKCSTKADYTAMLEHNLKKIRTQYNWARIVDEYETAFLDAIM